MPSTITPQQFVNKWKNVQLKESAAAQQHFLDLCRLLFATSRDRSPTAKR